MVTPLLTTSSVPSDASLSSSLPLLNSQAVPRHVAVIMDGNGRWATQRGLPRTEGHRRGAQSIQTILQCCQDWGIGALTVYAFSTENWNRPGTEVRFLMGLFEQLLRQKLAALSQEGVRLSFVGDLTVLPRSLQAAIQEATTATADHTGIRLAIALNYGGRHDIVRACRRLAGQVQSGELNLADIDEQVLGQSLDTADLGDPDLLIRTSGEMRLSNFLLWQMAYAEIYFTDTLWPDFDRVAFQEAVMAYQQRDRRFGGVKV